MDPLAAARAEDGFTLVELLVGALIALAVIGSTVALFTSAIQSEPRVSTRSAQVGEARTVAESISREVRQGWAAPVATASQLSVLTYIRRTTCGGSVPGPAIPCRVTYACASGACTRTAANANGSGAGPAERVVDQLLSNNVFSYSPTAAQPTFVGIRLALDTGTGEDAITIEDGVTFRNDSAPPAPTG